MSIDWQMTADMAAEGLRTATEGAISTIRARCENIAALETANAELRAKNAELRELVATLEAELDVRGSAARATVATAEDERRSVEERRLAKLEAEVNRLMGAILRDQNGHELRRAKARIVELEGRNRELREQNAALWWLSSDHIKQIGKVSLLPGTPGYIGPFWPKEKAEEWAG